MLRLTAILESEDPSFRENTVFVIDNASYHRGEDTMEALAKLDIPILCAGPYGYDGSPAETLFALLKVGDLNPAGISTGKL